MTPKERAKVLVVQLQRLTLRSGPTVIEAAIRDAENDIIACVSKRLESQADTADSGQRGGDCPRADASLAGTIPGFVLKFHGVLDGGKCSCQTSKATRAAPRVLRD
jgi:hypothetical protein